MMCILKGIGVAVLMFLLLFVIALVFVGVNAVVLLIFPAFGELSKLITLFLLLVVFFSVSFCLDKD